MIASQNYDHFLYYFCFTLPDSACADATDRQSYDHRQGACKGPKAAAGLARPGLAERRFRNLEQLFPGVLAFEKTEKRLRRILDTFLDIFTVLQFA